MYFKDYACFGLLEISQGPAYGLSHARLTLGLFVPELDEIPAEMHHRVVEHLQSLALSFTEFTCIGCMGH